MQRTEIKKFLGKLSLFLLPFALLLLVDAAVLPVDFFTFRSFEALRVGPIGRGLLPGPFYPLWHLARTEIGDLAAHSQYAVNKSVVWQTDELGYRNNPGTDKNQIVIVGDSTDYGGSLSQDQTLSVQLAQLTHKPVYSFSPAQINDYLFYLKQNRQPYPKVVVLTGMEASLLDFSLGDPVNSPGLRTALKRELHNWAISHPLPGLRSLLVFLDRLTKADMYNFLRSRIESFLQPPPLLVYPQLPSVVFNAGPAANQDVPQSEIDGIVAKLKLVSNELKAQGVRFIFLPVPNKENFYWQDLPGQKRPLFLKQLIAELKTQGVVVVDTQTAFDRARDKSGEILYHNDDTHWNARGVAVATQQLAAMLQGR